MCAHVLVRGSSHMINRVEQWAQLHGWGSREMWSGLENLIRLNGDGAFWKYVNLESILAPTPQQRTSGSTLVIELSPTADSPACSIPTHSTQRLLFVSQHRTFEMMSHPFPLTRADMFTSGSIGCKHNKNLTRGWLTHMTDLVAMGFSVMVIDAQSPGKAVNLYCMVGSLYRCTYSSII